MNTDDVQKLQMQLGFELPDAWIQLMLDYPASLQDLARHGRIGVREFELCNEPQLLAEFNEEVRDGLIFDSEGIAYDWPEEFLVIGDNGHGDYYCIAVNDPDCNVLYFDHQLGEFFELQETLLSFVDCLVEQYGGR